ncbi:MAG: hypothetical protein FJ095_10060 [Deltaproteobacteria bacterium]|nr:hypothetical protein [Deltaproteobacteria bacterium]
MPFKSVSGWKKLGSLEAEIVALSPYAPGSVCGAFSTDPVKVAIFPFAAGQVKVQGVSLDGCLDGALLDERVALLRGREELWAVLDVQHKPKIDPVGRSTRSLVNNPGTNSALALDWSGQGVELKLEGHEVVGREFPNRGTIRSCFLDGLNCYVVAEEGEGGGRFREHAGGTPESGTQIRCDLPLAAKKMSRVVGGPQLSALTRPGGMEVCVIRKVGAAAVEARTLSLDAAVADIAVLETTLFVATKDGRLLGFGGDVLHRTGDGGHLAPTFDSKMGAGCEPTVLAVTSRGGNRVWVGTKDGDVLRADAVKGSGLSA